MRRRRRGRWSLRADVVHGMACGLSHYGFFFSFLFLHLFGVASAGRRGHVYFLLRFQVKDGWLTVESKGLVDWWVSWVHRLLWQTDTKQTDRWYLEKMVNLSLSIIGLAAWGRGRVSPVHLAGAEALGHVTSRHVAARRPQVRFQISFLVSKTSGVQVLLSECQVVTADKKHKKRCSNARPCQMIGRKEGQTPPKKESETKRRKNRID